MLEGARAFLEDERALISRCRAGDDTAMHALYQRHSGRLYAMALRLTGSPPDAEDVVQDTFLRAWRSAGAFRGESSVGTWLCRIAINLSRDQLRRRVRTVADDAPDRAEPGDAGTKWRLQRSLGELPDGYREVLVMHDVLGMNHAEIGEVLGIEEGTSKSQLHKARSRMRELLGAAPLGGTS